MDITQRLQRPLGEQGWTEYKLAKVYGLSQSTLANHFKRNTMPSITTLETIFRGFGITLSQFFAEADMVEMTPELKEVFESWMVLTPFQKTAALQMLKAMNQNQSDKKPEGFLSDC